jgi:cell division transport system permease protein
MNSLKTTYHHIRRSPFQSLIAIIIVTVSFFSISAFLIISQGMSSVLKYVETKPEISLYLSDGLDKEKVENIHKKIKEYPEIREIKFISKEEALNIYKDLNKDNPMLTEMVSASILPASFEVSVNDPKTLDMIFEDFSQDNTISDIIYQKDLIENLLVWTKNIRNIGFFIAISLAVISFLVIFVIIGMKITNRKEEIKISRLLGASKFYVKKPFIYEGIFYGFIGSFAGSLVALIIAINLAPHLNAYFSPIIFISTEFNFYFLIIISQILLGTMIGFLSSFIGVKRYTKF